MSMHGECGQGERRTHGWPCYDEQRRPRLSGAAAATPHYWDRHLVNEPRGQAARFLEAGVAAGPWLPQARRPASLRCPG
jgi:hypothetical protein